MTKRIDFYGFFQLTCLLSSLNYSVKINYNALYINSFNSVIKKENIYRHIAFEDSQFGHASPLKLQHESLE
jgi:hypothetical protein